MQAEFRSLRAFDFVNATVHLWIFKKSSAATKYKASYVQIDDALKSQFIDVATNEMIRLTEASAYSYISQPNENSCLVTPSQDTDFALLKTQVDRPEPEHSIDGINDLKGAEGYVVKFTSNNETVYAVKRSTSSWKTSYPKKYINIIFANGELSAVENKSFSIERNFDFLSKDALIFISNKRGFESALTHKAPYTQAFVSLQRTPNFSSLFTNMQPLIDHIGSNSIQLRRMAIIEQKGFYSRPNFITTLINVNNSRNWGLNFDQNTNQIIPCAQTVKVIMQVLLDHRLISEITSTTYDVPDTVEV